MIKTRSFLSVLILFLSFTAQGQNVGTNVETQSTTGPNSSKGGVGAGIINVDAYTGTGSVNVMIHNYSVDGLGLGVSLGYNCKGARVDELASPAGLGWSLSAGGEIVRELHGIEDEVTMPSKFDDGVGGNTDTLQGILVPGSDPAASTVLFYDDVEPDVFSANIGGRSISFAYDKDEAGGVYKTYPASEIKIEIVTKDLSGGSYINPRSGVQKNSGFDSLNNLVCFIITDERGNKFYFSRGDYQIKSFSLPAHTPSTGTYYATTRWVMDSLVTYTGLRVKYSYVTTYMDYLENVAETFTASSGSVIKQEQRWLGRKKHLSKIEYPDGINILFDLGYTVDSRCDCKGEFILKNIIMESAYESSYKNSITYRLNHSYFNTPFQSMGNQLAYTTPCALIDSLYTIPYEYSDRDEIRHKHFERSLRLKLNSISRIGTDGTSTETLYSFGYNDTNLPLRFSGAKDFYGYYNGMTSNTHSVPKEGADRSYVFDSAQAWVLNRVTNGLGGKSSILYTDYSLTNPDCSYGDLSYPTNPYLTPMGCSIADANGAEVNDGLVVWKIIDEDGVTAQNNTTTEYSYSYGERFFRGGYMEYITPAATMVYTNYFVDPHNYLNGSNHGFSSVTVTVTGFGNQRLSKYTETFSNLMYRISAPLDPPVYASCIEKPTGEKYENFAANVAKHRMGLPLSVMTYDEHDYITSFQENEYEYVETDPIIGVNIATRFSPGPLAPEPWEYKVFDNKMARIKSASTKRYVYNAAVTGYKIMQTVYDYAFDAHNNIKRVTWQNSKGETFRKYHYYTYDYYPSYTGNSILSGMNTLEMKHMLSSEVWKMNGGSDSALLSYELSVPEITGSLIRPVTASFVTTLKEPLSAANAANTSYINRGNALDYHNTSSFGSCLKKIKQFIKYNNKGNILESIYGDQAVYSAAIWDTHFGHKIADVSNARYDDIAYTSFDGLYEGLSVSDYNKGNWDFDNNYQTFYTNITGLDNALTGKYVYDLVKQGSTVSYMKSQPLHAIKYIISFWVYATPSGGFTVDKFSGSSNTGSITVTLQNTVGQWKLYTGTFTPASGEYVKIANPGGINPATVCLDEVRLYPADATMMTSTFKPLFGVGSSCDGNNLVSHVEYDAQGRVTITRDMRGNIISKTETFSQDADANTSSLTPNITY